MILDLDVSDIVQKYLEKSDLDVQDIVKCYLQIYEKAGFIGYDRRKKFQRMRPGDVVYVNNAFHPLVSYPRIDNTLTHTCTHVREEEMCKTRGQTKRITTCPFTCRKWYFYYKTDKGSIKLHLPDFDGCTTISREHIAKVIHLLTKRKNHRVIKDIKEYYKTLPFDEVAKQIRDVRRRI